MRKPLTPPLVGALPIRRKGNLLLASACRCFSGILARLAIFTFFGSALIAVDDPGGSTLSALLPIPSASVRTRLGGALLPSITQVQIGDQIGEIRLGVGTTRSWIYRVMSSPGSFLPSIRFARLDNVLRVQFVSPKGVWVVEASEDLRVWAKVAELSAPEFGEMPVLELPTSSLKMQFVRSVFTLAPNLH